MTDMIDRGAMIGAVVNGAAGDKLGTVESVYFDSDTDEPEWAAVRADLAGDPVGGHVSLVPLTDGAWDGSTLTVPFDADAFRSAPRHDPDAVISSTDEYQLYRHYGMTERAAVLGDRFGDVGSTRAEEQPLPGTERHAAGRVRLRRHIPDIGR